ncbi:deoxyribose-phosphate aldolase [Cyathus striatus]|nr:deoxyribose-phosphate aldolase [Cyathus striatus]
MSPMSPRTNEEWTSFINAKLDEVVSVLNSDSQVGPFASITSPEDPKFPLVVDHTLLKPDATLEQIDKLCDEAIMFGFKSCCVNSSHIKRVSSRLQGSKTIACSVVGFPLGAMSAEAKAFETKQAVQDGASEIDTVIPVGYLKSKGYAFVFHDLHLTISAASSVPVKVIIETSLLTQQEKIAACYIAAEAGATFVKTSTGFNGGGATVEDVRLMRKTVAYKGENVVKVKASGGVRTWEACREMLVAGAERIGTSSGSAIMQNIASQAAY